MHQSVTVLRESGLLKMKLPVELGDAEAQLALIEAVTQTNPSAGWCIFIGPAIAGLAGAILPDEAIGELFAAGRVRSWLPKPHH